MSRTDITGDCPRADELLTEIDLTEAQHAALFDAMRSLPGARLRSGRHAGSTLMVAHGATGTRLLLCESDGVFWLAVAPNEGTYDAHADDDDDAERPPPTWVSDRDADALTQVGSDEYECPSDCICYWCERSRHIRSSS